MKAHKSQVEAESPGGSATGVRVFPTFAALNSKTKSGFRV